VEEAAEEERRRAEAALTEKEDHDNRALKFADRFPMADKNKNEGTELFKGGNFKPAAERYIKALGHLAKLVHVEQMMKEEEHAQARALKVSCHNNLAMCFLKLELWGKAAENASKVLELEADNSKAMFRRAQACLPIPALASAALVSCGCRHWLYILFACQ
jgi:tetratricopeptide (TPR) repeat protein